MSFYSLTKKRIEIIVIGLVSFLIFGSYILPPGVRALDVIIGSGENIQTAIDKSPEGTSFIIKPGVYRYQSLVPKNGNSFIGEPGAILSGAKVLTLFEQQGQYWVTTNQLTQSEVQGVCKPDFPGCAFPEDVFIDDAPLQRVTKLDDVTPGKWYFDYNNSKVYLADNPSGHYVEMSVTRYAFTGWASNVTIRGLIIEKYASPASSGALWLRIGPAPQGQNWVIEKNEVRFNHGAGVRLVDGAQLRENKIHHNGQIGIRGTGNNILVEGNEIAYNNYAGYSFNWEAGGTKFSFTDKLVVRNNFVHHNDGPGLWTDADNYNVLYEYNHTKANKIGGIFHEISFDAVIRFNIIEEDGFNSAGTRVWNGSGIIVNASSNVEIYGNKVINCMNGVTANQSNRGLSKSSGKSYLVQNLYVHDNIITQTTGVAAGIWKAKEFDDSIFTSWNNRYENNTYTLGDINGKYYEWMNSYRTKEEWQAFGNDLNGKWLPKIAPPTGLKVIK